MENFNSIFELFTAFNFAYVISYKFTESLHKRLSDVYLNVISELKNIKTSLKASKNYLAEVNNDHGEHSIVQELNREVITLKEEYTLLQKEISEKIVKYGIVPKFNHYCLIAGIYSFTILFLSGLDILKKDNVDHMNHLFMFNLLVGVLIFLLFYKNITIIQPSYNAILVTTGIVIFLYGGFCLIYHRLNWNFYIINFYYINIIISFLISSFHFIFIFFRALINKNSTAQSENDRVIQFQTKCTKFSEKIKHQLEIIKNYHVAPIETKK